MMIADAGRPLAEGFSPNTASQNLPCCGGWNRLPCNLPPTRSDRADREEVVNRLCLRILAALALASLPAGAALSAELTAQDYPARPIRLIVSFPAGSSDVLGRAFAQHAMLGQLVVVENVPGANGAIGLTRLAKSAPDGHTVALGATTNLAVSPHLNSKLA